MTQPTPQRATLSPEGAKPEAFKLSPFYKWAIHDGKLKTATGMTLADLRYVGCTESIQNLILAAPDLLSAAMKVLAGLNQRIDAAKEAGIIPIFEGIADLHSAIRKATEGQ